MGAAKLQKDARIEMFKLTTLESSMSAAWWIFVLIAASLMISIAVGCLIPDSSKSQAVTAWFQAIGSITAIIGSFWIGERQARAALQSVIDAHVLEQKGCRNSILAVAEAAAEHAHRIDNAFSQQNPRAALMLIYDRTIIDGMLQALNSVPAHEVGSRNGVIALLSLRDQFVFLGVAIDTYIAGSWMHPEIKQAIDACGDSREIRDDTVRAGETALARNVQIHLDKIRHDYGLLEHAIRSQID